VELYKWLVEQHILLVEQADNQWQY